jgi:hypothetical protein
MKASIVTICLALVVIIAGTDLAAAPPIRATAVHASCSTQVTSCGGLLSTLSPNNGFSLTLDTLTHNFYDSKPEGLTYKIYGANDDPAVATPIDSFTCKKKTPAFHSAKLANGTTYRLQISAGVVKSAVYTFTTGASCNGAAGSQNNTRRDGREMRPFKVVELTMPEDGKLASRSQCRLRARVILSNNLVFHEPVRLFLVDAAGNATQIDEGKTSEGFVDFIVGNNLAPSFYEARLNNGKVSTGIVCGLHSQIQ